MVEARPISPAKHDCKITCALYNPCASRDYHSITQGKGMAIAPASGWRCIFCSAAPTTWRPQQGQRLHAAAAATKTRKQASGDKTLSRRPLVRRMFGYDDAAQASDDVAPQRRSSVHRTLGYADSPHRRDRDRGLYVSVVRRGPRPMMHSGCFGTRLERTIHMLISAAE